MKKRGLRYPKKNYITAIRMYYGCTISQAEKYYNESPNSTLEALYDGFLRNSKRSFYTD